MRSNLYLLWFLVIWQPTSCFYNLCHTPKNNILSNEECSELYFEPSEKATDLGRVELKLEQNSLKITPAATTWTNTFLRITKQSNETSKFCSTLTKEDALKSYCITFKPEAENETFLLEYKVENLPEISSRRFLFSVPNLKEIPIFLYVDQTDTSRLVLKAQKLPPAVNVTYYKVEAYKEKNENTNLQDLRMFGHNDDISYELFTYNDVGNYYFVVWVMSEGCSDCLKISTPKIFIGRKSTRVVIGIVGASFILPFILFIFHILTKRFPSEENGSKSEEKLVVAYKSSFKKHNEVVLGLAAFLEKMSTSQVELVDLSKPTKKFSDKFCLDSIIIADHIVYVAPPKHDLNPIFIDKSLSEKDFFGVIFDYCTEQLPPFFESNKTFKLFDEFEKFMQALNISGSYDTALYHDLRRKTEEAKIETDRLNTDTLPKIIVTDSEPQENDSLISAKVVL